MLDNKVRDDKIFIEGFSKEVFRNDHPSNIKIGDVCTYFREGLPIMRRKDHELLQEIAVAEVNVGRRRIFMVTVYRSPSQTSEQFEVFMGNPQRTVTRLRQENSTAIVLMGYSNCRSS